MGVQTAVKDKRKGVLGRVGNNDETEIAVTLLKKHKLSVYLEYIFGLPGETIEDILPYLPSETQLYVPKVLATVALREGTHSKKRLMQ